MRTTSSSLEDEYICIPSSKCPVETSSSLVFPCLTQIRVAATATGFEPNISHFDAVFSLNIRCVRVLNQRLILIFRLICEVGDKTETSSPWIQRHGLKEDTRRFSQHLRVTRVMCSSSCCTLIQRTKVKKSRRASIVFVFFCFLLFALCFRGH